MFHVGTMMRYSKDDPQQVVKKRHIGNDNVVILFQENETCQYKTDMIKSNMIYLLIIVTNLSKEKTEKPKYKINIAAKNFVNIEELQLT